MRLDPVFNLKDTKIKCVIDLWSCINSLKKIMHMQRLTTIETLATSIDENSWHFYKGLDAKILIV